jgi:hypothetical protein
MNCSAALRGICVLKFLVEYIIIYQKPSIRLNTEIGYKNTRFDNI